MKKNNLKNRTILSFVVFFALAGVLVSAWWWMSNQPKVDFTPKPFRQVLELNGQIWKSLFNKNKINECSPVAKGKKPRVNGAIGLKQDFDPENWKLEVTSGAQHLTLTMKDILALPRTETRAEFRCIEGWSDDVAYAGVKFSDFMKAFQLNPNTYVGLITPDEAYYVSLDIESMMHSQTLLAYEMNGEPISLENGAPLRLIVPVKYGIKSIKRIGKVYFSDIRPPDYWAEQGYDWFAGL